MSSLAKLCPNCGVANPSQVTICRNCGFLFEQGKRSTKETGQTAQVVQSRTGWPLGVEIVIDWVAIFFSLGFNLKQFRNDKRRWIKFVIDVCALAVISGMSLLIFDAVTANMSGEFAGEVQSVRGDLGMEDDTTTRVLSEIVFAFGSAIGTIFYLIIVHFIAVFFEGKGDLSDHLHMNLSVDVVYNLLLPLSFLAGAIDIFLFLAVAGFIILYRVYLQLRVIQVVHQIPFVFALLAAIAAPMIFSCVWLPISAGG